MEGLALLVLLALSLSWGLLPLLLLFLLHRRVSDLEAAQRRLERRLEASLPPLITGQEAASPAVPAPPAGPGWIAPPAAATTTTTTAATAAPPPVSASPTSASPPRPPHSTAEPVSTPRLAAAPSPRPSTSGTSTSGPGAAPGASAESPPPPAAAAAAAPAGRSGPEPSAPSAPPGLVASPRPPVGSGPVAGTTVWAQLERTLIENGTGLLGVAVLVAGLTFLSLNLGLRLGPLLRFLLTLAAGAGLITPSLLWGAHPRWRPFTLWLRSGGAALILFACMAAGFLPQLGLRWITDPIAALALLLAGISLNLALAWLTRHQAIASLHGLLSLLPLLLVPADATPLALAAVITTAGQSRPGRPGWDRHRLLLLLGYGLFQGIWIARAGSSLAGSPPLQGGAVLAAALVSGSALAMLQRSMVRRQPAGRVRLAALIAAWGGLGYALLLIPQLAAVRSTGLLLAAALAAGLSRRARPLAARSHQLAHRLSAQALLSASLLALQPLLNDGLLLTAVLLLESSLFLVLMLREGDRPAQRVGWWLVLLWAIVLLLQGLAFIPFSAAAVDAISLRPSALLIAAAALLALVQQRWQQQAAVPFGAPPLAWLAATLAWQGSALVAPADWRGGLALLAMGTLLWIGRRLGPDGLGRATAMATAAAHLVSWLWLLPLPRGPLAVTVQLLPLALLALLLFHLAPGRRSRSLGLDLFGLDLGLAAFLLLEPIAPPLPVPAWLLLSLLALAAADRLPRRQADHALALAVGALGAGALHFHGELVDDFLPWTLLGFDLPPRWPLELLALGVLLAWWFHRPRGSLQGSGLWRRVHAVLPELILLTAVLLLAREVAQDLLAISWSLLALLLLAPPLRRWFVARWQWYGVAVYAGAILTDLALLERPAAPSAWYGQAGLHAWLALLLQGLFVLLSRRWLEGSPLRPPALSPEVQAPEVQAPEVRAPDRQTAPFPALAALARRIAARPHRWLGYPLFVAIALQLASGYDHALLTLLWALEAFAIFVLSALLRDHQFRIVSLVALGACLLRLLAVDMERADLGLRGLVFIGVGLLMLTMNAIVNRFRDRFR